MPRPDYKTCKECGRSSDEAGELSHTRLCSMCSESRLRASVLEQVNHSGPTFQLWRRRIAASVGAKVLDDVQQSV